MLNLIPLAVIESILFIVGFILSNHSLFKYMYKLGWRRFVPFVVTILGVVFIDLLKGISLGTVSYTHLTLPTSV